MPTLSQCPLDAALLQLIDEPDVVPEAYRHAQGCGSCRRRLARLRREHSVLQAFAPWIDTAEVESAADGHERFAISQEGASAPIPAAIGRFPVRGLIASGGQADLLLATHPTLGCDVVIKLARFTIEAGSDAVSIEHEARALARLKHPAFPKVYDADLWGGRPYLVMELVEGLRLTDIVRQRAPTNQEITQRMQQLADAVAETHANGFLHLDLKPDNVLITLAGHVKLIDFGAAGLVLGNDFEHSGSVLFGTPEYMAPEQSTGDLSRVSPRTDVYGLGGLLYFQLYGEAPHAAERSAPTFEHPPYSIWRDEEDGGVTDKQNSLQNLTRIRLIAICRQALAASPLCRQLTVRHLATELQRVTRADFRLRLRRCLAACSILIGLVLILLSFVSPPDPAPPAGSTRPIDLGVQVFRNHRSASLAVASPLHTGDKLQLRMSHSIEGAGEAFLVVTPEVIIPIAPWKPDRHSEQHSMFPASGRGWPIGQHGRFGLLIAVRTNDNGAPSLDRLRNTLQQINLQSPTAIACVEFWSRMSAQEWSAKCEWEVESAAHHAATAQLNRLRLLLDKEFNCYHAYFFRYDESTPIPEPWDELTMSRR